MADMVRDYRPADWDRIFRTARKMLAEESGLGLFDRKFAAGWDAVKLLLRYRWNKRRHRDFVSIHESDYVY
jgi:electron-transferring-flavoprotein dehydrogenase